MLRAYTQGKVAVFIDAANILYSQQTLHWKIAFKKIIDYVNSECGPSLFYYYSGNIATLERQNAFLEKLKDYGYNVFTKEVKFIDGARSKGNLDVELSLDAYRLSSQYQTLILFSGDSDFAYLIDLLIEKCKRVIVVSTRDHISKELLIRAKYIDLLKLRDYIEWVV